MGHCIAVWEGCAFGPKSCYWSYYQSQQVSNFTSFTWAISPLSLLSLPTPSPSQWDMEDLDPPSAVDGPSLVWQPDNRRNRKSGCSNIFAGVNMRQLRRLFHVAGDRDAEQRARLVLARSSREGERDGGEDEREGEVEAGLAQALVGFRAKARSRSGIRTDGHREPKWLKAFGHLRIKERLNDTEKDVEGQLDSVPGGSTEVGCSPAVSPKALEGPHLCRLGAVTRQEVTKDPELYLHRILH
ncbi:hypothetical protein UPYG_G00059680 [Umbra pygmaea]|uniref:Arginine vasopressin-induced protein 1 n=1 Tax=Umbra pygmaea TaxID=75934 RepID=A0ABD0XQZ7_UMBPY